MTQAIFPFPTLPELPASAHASAPMTLRYDDLTQAGQIKLVAMPLAIGRACFKVLWSQSPMVAVHAAGIMPILTRMVIEVDAASVALGAKLEARGSMQLAHEPDAQGQAQALVLNMLAELHGPRGRSFGKQPEGLGSMQRLGRVFAEHVFTKPFAPAGERKVLRFEVPGIDPVPSAQHARTMPASLLQLPTGADALDADFSADIAPWSFGLMHTDHNQHVNSLVYARLFEEAALRRLAQHGQDIAKLAHSIELVYRKPCFAGETLTCKLRAFRAADRVGAIGYLGAADATPERAHCTLRMLF